MFVTWSRPRIGAQRWRLVVWPRDGVRSGCWPMRPSRPCNYVDPQRVDAVERSHFLRCFIFNAISTSRRNASEREG
jgi:hypothetical protein